MNNLFTRNAYLLFSPLLLVYGLFIFFHKAPAFFGDEPHYISFAQHLLHGYYSGPPPNIDLWYGPGYPVILMPLVALHPPVVFYPLLNAVFYYLSVVFFYMALNYVVNPRLALLFSVTWAIYPNMFALLPVVYTEVFTACLITGFIYCLTLYHVKGKRKHLIIAGLLLGYLALTKVIFGYIITLCLLICLCLLLVRKVKFYYLKSVYILLIALGVTIPYLIYTYSLTNKPFYWGNSGGMSLYWMSTPFEHEYGDWKSPYLTTSQYPMNYHSAEGDAMLKKNHAKEIKQISKYNEIRQEELYKQIAVKNIETHPVKYIRNYFYNISRLLFNFPYSYSYQNAGVGSNIISGSLILYTSLIAAVLSLLNWKRIVYPVKFSLFIVTIYLLLTAMVSAYPRQLDVVLPILLFWIAFTAEKMPKLSLSFTNTPDLD